MRLEGMDYGSKYLKSHQSDMTEIQQSVKKAANYKVQLFPLEA